RERYTLLTSLIVPRPIAWVSTWSKSGGDNLAPFSFFGGVSASPPVLAISIGSRRGEPKDTVRNILENGEFVVNFATVAQIDFVERSAQDFPYEVSEASALGLTLLKSEKVAPGRLEECPVQLECRLVQTVLPQGAEVHLFLGEVLWAHIQEDLMEKGVVDPLRFDPLMRLGGGWYGKLGEIIRPGS
ncbi:MAG: flavin reductase family protein, partial [Planctomycetota bacterium]|nr:flavin reductase family protein [Planctomycetota bacterium]